MLSITEDFEFILCSGRTRGNSEWKRMWKELEGFGRYAGSSNQSVVLENSLKRSGKTERYKDLLDMVIKKDIANSSVFYRIRAV